MDKIQDKPIQRGGDGINAMIEQYNDLSYAM